MKRSFSLTRAWMVIVCCLSVGSLAGEEQSWERLPKSDVGRSKRLTILDELLQRLPANKDDDVFPRYLADTGELPPDFDSMPSQFYLPDPLSWFQNGQRAPVLRSDWPERRREILALTEEWLLGTAPSAPGNVRAEILEKEAVAGQNIWKVRLSFGPNHAASLGVKLYLPKDEKPSGIFICDGERYLPWVQKAMDNGFGVAIHNARDGRSDESLAYANLFGDYNWSSFRRRGWSASRVLDWLVTLPFVDANRIYIGGHSRSGKVALTAAAFDERFAGVIASSPGSGGSIPYRYCDQSFFGESAELLTRKFPDWVLPRVRMFCGNEDKLPADSHFLYALIAPRLVLMSTATEDSVESTWAVEQVYQSIQPVYELLGASPNLVQRYRPGGHTINDEATHTAFSDFLLVSHDQAQLLERFPRKPIHVWNYENWLKKNPELTVKGEVDVTSKLNWLLSLNAPHEKRPVLTDPDVNFPSSIRSHFQKMRDLPNQNRSVTTSDIKMTLVQFGEGITGCLYEPDEKASRPVVIWLGPFQTSQGYAAPFYRCAVPAPQALLKAGFPVFTFDPIGTFLRQQERRDFFDRFPHASLMGKMVEDTRHAIDAVAQILNKPRQIYLYGYSMGGTVALLTAGIDERVDGVVSVAGFTPFRKDTAEKRTGGISRWSHLYGWLPTLGAVVGREQDIPVGFGEIIASLAPRKILIVAPTFDRHATHADVVSAVKFANQEFERKGIQHGVELHEPHDENRLTDAMQNRVIDWLLQESSNNMDIPAE